MSNFEQDSVQPQPQLPNSNENDTTSAPAPIQGPEKNQQLPSQFEFINKINETEKIPENPQQQLNINQNMIIENKDNLNNNNIANDNNQNINTNKANKEANTHELNKTKLENKFSFWYRIDDNIQYQTQKQALDKKEYEVQVKKIDEFDTVEDFWGIFQHLRKPDSCRPGIEYFMFKEPIKPMWEDENNKNGGRISIKLRKDYTTIIWEEMIFALIGGILPKEMKDEINGIVVTSRKEFNTLQIWFKTYENDLIDDLKQCIRDLLIIPPEVNLEIKQFNKNNNNNNNNKKEYNYNSKKSGGYYNKGYNNNYYDDGEYEYYNKDKNEHKKNKHQNYKNK